MLGVEIHQHVMVVTVIADSRSCLCMQARADMPCHSDPALPEMYALVRSETLLEERLKGLTHQVSRTSLLHPCLSLGSRTSPSWGQHGLCIRHHC